ncbi:molecular chaperone DnaJ [Duncaniella sp. C9]|nr:molecular chaperone DnaJ [Duncaniella sp. C9]QCP71704.1 molecular chaperone DnaJ [Duncaniella sp. B8]
MEKEIKRPPRIAVCRECNGTGVQRAESPQRYPDPCPQCEGSGRVTVSSVTTLDIRPYKQKTIKPI